jgi:hypothetical protein
MLLAAGVEVTVVEDNSPPYPAAEEAPSEARSIGDLVELDLRAENIRSAAESGTCPNCGRVVEPGSGLGSGRIADGIFCSLDCFASFHYPVGPS